jgi:hypothetical protein
MNCRAARMNAGLRTPPCTSEEFCTAFVQFSGKAFANFRSKRKSFPPFGNSYSPEAFLASYFQ